MSTPFSVREYYVMYILTYIIQHFPQKRNSLTPVYAQENADKIFRFNSSGFIQYVLLQKNLLFFYRTT